MSKNRFASIRYQVLDRCLSDRSRYYTIYDLAHQCSKAIFKVDEVRRNPVTTRQIRYDLRHLESEAGYKAEILSEKIPGQTRHYFRYADPKFSISKRPLSDEDIDNLKTALHILQRFRGMHNEKWIDNFAARIESLDGLNRGMESNENEIIRFEHEDFFRGGEWIVPLYRAIDKKQCVDILYEPFGKAPEAYRVSPYLLKQYNKRWFLLCKSEGLAPLTTLPLDRIIEANPGTGAYIPYHGNRPSEFFEDIIGVVNKEHEPVLEITLEVEKTLLPYIESKPVHESQRPKTATKNPDWFSVILKLKPNYEFYSVILSHGPRIRVTSPDSVKENLKSLIQKMMDHY